MPCGYAGKIAFINLSEASFTVEELDEGVAKKFLGGKGLGAYLLFHHMAPSIHPYDPENVLIFTTGPLTGTGFPATSRSAVITKSPLTGTFSDSYAGTYFGPQLKRSGFDAVVITGRAAAPCSLLIDDGRIQIRDAGHLWGLSCSDVEARLREEFKGEGRMSIAGIGPAGEKGVRFANILSAKRAHGRGGSGAVMGSKNLKAVVLKGDHAPEIAHRDRFDAIVKAVRNKILSHHKVGKGGDFPRIGTMHTVDVTQETGTLPSRNWQENTFEQGPSIGAEAFEKYIVRARACHGCPIGCSRDTKITRGGEEIVTEGPEYETIYAFGSDCGIDDPEIIIAADQLCDDYGMDTISCGATIAFAMECFEKGLITRGDTGGMDLRFGNGEALLETVHLIGRREGIGALLSEGTKRASEKMEGASGLAIQVKGMELPAYDPRGMKGQGLTYALSDRGGCHLRSNALRTELLGIPEPVDRYTYEGKAEMIRGLQLNAVTTNCLIACFFSTFAVVPEEYCEALSALTGWSVTPGELRTIAERTWNLTRMFNVREGFTRREDTLPERLFTQASTRGPSKGEVVDRASFEKMLDAYYGIAGWDPRTGIPTREKLEALDIGDLATHTR